MSKEDTYSKACRLAKLLQNDLTERLQSALQDLGDPYLVRWRFDPSRPKDRSSLEQKAAQKGWTLEQAITEAWDFLGFRLVCNNLQDAERAATLIQKKLEQEGFEVKRQDYIQKPRKTGYRAVHLLFKAPITIGSESVTLGCEIQIRTLLQHTWAELSRADFYKARIPRTLQNRMQRLANSLAQAERIAELIRQDVARPRRGRKPKEGTRLKSSALAYLYRKTFDEDPPEYLIQWVLRDYGDTPVRTDGLDQVLRDSHLMEELIAEYSGQVPWSDSFPPQKELLFVWAVHAAAHGKNAARTLAKRTGREAWEEVDAQYKSEISYTIPENWTDLKAQLECKQKDEDPFDNIHLWADYFDASRAVLIAEGS